MTDEWLVREHHADSVNDGGGGQGFFQSLVPFLRFRIQGVAAAA